MGVNIKIKLDVMNVIDRARDMFGDEVKNKFGQELINSIGKGVNPVSEGTIKQAQYSDSYKNAIRKGYVKGKTKVSPVDLKQSGDLHKSLRMIDTDKGIKILFDDPKAIYHNDLGVGKAKIKRRLLPTNAGERFSNSLFVRIVQYLKDSISKATK